MPSFRGLPPSLRPAVRSRVAEPPAPTDQRPLSRALVDCGVYLDGARLPGVYSPAEARAKVRELEETGQDAFVWIGLHEPDERQMHDVAEVFGLHPLATEDAVHAHQRPKLERYDETLFSGAEDRELRATRLGRAGPGGRRDGRDHDLRRQQLRDHGPAR